MSSSQDLPALLAALREGGTGTKADPIDLRPDDDDEPVKRPKLKAHVKPFASQPVEVAEEDAVVFQREPEESGVNTLLVLGIAVCVGVIAWQHFKLKAAAEVVVPPVLPRV